ncbi:hypothetical protein SAMN04487895_11490 [Paenibacillus sophorae]|uniref:DUF4365 domain-containing protein n=1 Tax=Paenibacillus sophorae TaxID=1333845 RepID=A0A1H8TJM5_9BACL|nr:DUF4365 domain-containing protein [Paenibacillus sophorae]QWU16249.1 DUF4365 domain-containing protein [Paenibacillus sophorae]SEO91067.1 hypothetical protein SAMN04487895_11490 [Paenibacillus sophorae]
MPNKNWTVLNSLQLGRYAEYFAKMEFASYGLEVFTSEVDDRGIDFIVKNKAGSFLEIQVKSLRGTGYVLAQKSKFNINNPNLYMALLIFKNNMMPDFFLIPAKTWAVPNAVFVDRDYNKPGQTSKPEYGINISVKNYSTLQFFDFENSILSFL